MEAGGGGGYGRRRWGWWQEVLPLWRVLLAASMMIAVVPARARLYQAGADPVWVLEAATIRKVLRGSPSAWLVQFYSSACGHCVAFAPTWKALAGDVREWEPAIRIGVLDCGDEVNYETCKDYGVQYYPTFRYFRAFAKDFTTGENYHAGSDRELQTVRQTMIDFLQNHSRETKPPACPPLEPIMPEEMLSLLNKGFQHFTAVIFESADSYVGREVILDLSQYENIVVKRVLDSNTAFLKKLSITSVPSSYLIYPNGSHGLINILKPLRSFFSSYLKSLPGIGRKPPPTAIRQNQEENQDIKEWKDFDKSKLYMADLESGLHYLLRIELATHKTLEGDKLNTFKDVVLLFAKLFPGQQPVMKLLETLKVWLHSLPLDRIPYDAILDLLNNKMRISGLFLPSRIQWVGCQGSRAELRGYPCSFWKLFHVLTVQAAVQPQVLFNTDFEYNPQVVLQVLRKYLRDFFGCQACSQHFEKMAEESLKDVNTLDEAVLWLWEKHNVVNARLAGGSNEDPKFPKLQWPTPDICPLCHEKRNGLHAWNEAQVLQFLKHHYSSGNILYTYTEEGSKEEADKNSHKKHTRRNEEWIPDREQQLDPKSHVLDILLAKDQNKPLAKEEMKSAVYFLGIGFSNIDMSLCIVLYVASSFFLMIMYFFFRMRSKRRKLWHPRPYV
ncbi:sulfhydryl oxidase 2 isoform X1 [Zootoca vivipara]|uniref:sulfhydryl oxidase 2 isoform X1 n=1 Tax=Zootoca vivipara TaxID=8524 RepID=UPI00293BF906|nr:sulfhydryl oxidase 2 isoform X1 [Zootoca vivipara]